ncbi:hypothetical protein CPC08DRAFT_647013 [Agrocybe pediades]|nr:hypothetical protein CPC08DRAFT_647013 [Agrocybe pediades]
MSSDLAFSFGPEGQLTAQDIRMMDDYLKVAISHTVKSINAIPAWRRDWDTIISAFHGNGTLELEAHRSIDRGHVLRKEGRNVFKFDGSPDASIVKEVQSFYSQLVNDADVLKHHALDITDVADIVAQTGATVDSFTSFFAKTERHEKVISDVGIIRFPYHNRPYFQVYRIRLSAWSESSRVLMVQDDTNGITGEYVSRFFKPRKAVIDAFEPRMRRAAIDDAETLLNGGTPMPETRQRALDEAMSLFG